MKRSLIIIALALLACLVVLGLLALVTGDRAVEQAVDPAAATSPAPTPSTTAAAPEDHQGFLYGRVTNGGGVTYEGRLRWGGGEEAFWGVRVWDGRRGVVDLDEWRIRSIELLPTTRPAHEVRIVDYHHG